MLPHDAVTVVLTKPSGEILMQLRDDGNGNVIPYPNMWNFPGGAIEEGEAYIDTAVREMEEEFELKINPDNLKLVWTYGHDNTKNDYVLAGNVDSNAKLVLHEGADMQWFTLEQIKKLELGFEQAKILPYVEQFLKSEGLGVSA
jgi:8-oxo-dGTP diphosphatase